MSKIDLSKVETRELIHELQERGYYTNLLWCLEDVDRQLTDVNEDRDEDKKIVLSREQKLEILDECINLDWHCEEINGEIYDKILNYE